MATIVLIGSGIGGTIGGLVLARDGHHVTVLDRDPQPPTSAVDAFDGWQRRGVPQFRMTHVVLPRLRELLDDELPDAVHQLEANGALRVNRLRQMPPTITGDLRPSDARYDQVTGRRAMVEATLAAMLDREPGVVVRRGVGVAGFVTADGRPEGVPHVAGVALEGGQRIEADLVVVASGRRAALPAMLAATGAEAPPEDVASHGFTYYCRAYRSADGEMPMMFGPPLQHYDGISFVTVPGDNGTWSIAFCGSSRDRWLRRAADNTAWEQIVQAYPLVAHWTSGEPISDVETMSATPDRRTHFAVDCLPTATGVIALGDALACTSPLFGRGMTFAALQAVCLRDVLREVSPTEPGEFAHRWCDRVGNIVMPLIEETLDAARHRLAEMDAQIAGRPYEPDDPTWTFTRRLFGGAADDPDVLRAVMDVAGVFDRVADITRRRDIVARLETLAPPTAAPGPTRRELEELCAATA